MSQQPPRDPLDENNRPVGPARSMTGNEIEDVSDRAGADKEVIRGSQAGDRMDNTVPGDLEGEDTEKTGAKPPDAMGAGG